MSQEDIVIVGMARTPMGGLLGDLANVSAPELGAVAVKAAVKDAGIAVADSIFRRRSRRGSTKARRR
jgi:acetyl-CoA C-acetyltransferase